MQVEGFWMAYQSLPVEQQEWDASQKLRAEILHYRKVLPLLQKLHSKVPEQMCICPTCSIIAVINSYCYTCRKSATAIGCR